MRILFALTLLIILYVAKAQPVKLYETDTLFKAPESVVYDPLRNLLYVSNYTEPLKEGSSYGRHSISKVDLNGNIIEQEWITGLSCPTGITIYMDKLYIVERFGVVVYNLSTHTVDKKHYIKTTDFLNDITISPEGTIYVSVSGTNRIYRIEDERVEVWLDHDSIPNPNGLLYHNSTLYAATIGDGSVKNIDPENKRITTVCYVGEGTLDGIQDCGNGLLVSIFQGNLYWVSTDGTKTELLNTRDDKTFLADFEYIQSKELLIIPALWNNKLLFYSYNPE